MRVPATCGEGVGSGGSASNEGGGEGGREEERTASLAMGEGVTVVDDDQSLLGKGRGVFVKSMKDLRGVIW